MCSNMFPSCHNLFPSFLAFKKGQWANHKHQMINWWTCLDNFQCLVLMHFSDAPYKSSKLGNKHGAFGHGDFLSSAEIFPVGIRVIRLQDWSWIIARRKCNLLGEVHLTPHILRFPTHIIMCVLTCQYKIVAKTWSLFVWFLFLVPHVARFLSRKDSLRE